MDCKLCNITENKQLLQGMKLYEDEMCIALLSKKPASLCHVIVYPKKHATIIEQVSDEEVMQIFKVCNKISRAMFESLNIQGTNILVQNGVAAGQDEPHFCMHIVSRMENDGIKLSWEPKKMSEEEMSTVELQYRQMTDGNVFESKKAEKKEAVPVKEEKAEEKEEDSDEENYMLKYFNKMP